MRKLAFACAATALFAGMLTGLSTTSAGAASSTPVAFPSSPKGLEPPVDLPKEVDPPSRYLPQVACQPGTLTGVAKLRDLVMSTYGVGGIGNTARTCSEGTSEHADGRAWDWLVDVKNTEERKAAADFLAWLTADDGKNARRLGVMYVIYNKKIWAVYRAKDGWRTSSGHEDHVHISFSWNGARGTTSFWTGKVHPVDVGPCTRFTGQPATVSGKAHTSCYSSTALVRKTELVNRAYGSRAGTIKTAQRLVGAPITGVFDLTTRSKVMAYQRGHDLPVTGTLDQPTWASLWPSRRTYNAVAGMSGSSAAAYGAANYPQTLKDTDTGKPVIVLQVALRMPLDQRNGHYRTKTVAAVKAKQKQLGRPVTGKWTAADWKALAG